MPGKGDLIESTTLYSEKCVELLKRALEVQQTDSNLESAANGSAFRSRYADSSSSESEGGESDGSSESENEESPLNTVDEQTPTTTSSKPVAQKQPRPAAFDTPDARKKASLTRKHAETLICDALPLDKNNENTGRGLYLPVALLSKKDRSNASSLETIGQSFLDLAQNLQTHQKTVVVLSLRSGRFAGAVFRGPSTCLVHRVTTRYTVRKGQGKAQSSQDSQRRAQSMGSQLRRAGQVKLQEDIQQTLESWKEHVDEACLIFLTIPKTMLPTFYDSAASVISRTDERIRRMPLDLGRPTFESVSLAYSIMMTVDIRSIPQDETSQPNTSNTDQASHQGEISKRVSAHFKEQSPAVPVPQEEDVSIPLSALHVAAKNGDLEVLRDLLSSSCDDINKLAGPLLMAPLHFAAESTISNDVSGPVAADMVRILLLTSGADPTQVDIRSRPPYFLASNEKVRDAFRQARAELGEDHCDWHASKVGPPLTTEDLQARKEKEAEKRRRKKAKAKEKKAKEKAQAVRVAEQLAEKEKQKKQEEEAKRIRDGLQPKSNQANACDFCQTIVKGRKRSQMFKRLDYKYCSSECVQKHKRELMAKAALSRFG